MPWKLGGQFRRFVNVGDLALRADGDKRVKARFKQAADVTCQVLGFRDAVAQLLRAFLDPLLQRCDQSFAFGRLAVQHYCRRTQLISDNLRFKQSEMPGYQMLFPAKGLCHIAERGH